MQENAYCDSGTSPTTAAGVARLEETKLLSDHNPQFEPFLTDADVGKLLGGLHPKTVQRMARRGDIPHHRIGRYYRYRASELNDWLMLHSVGQIDPSASTRKEIQ